MKDQLTSLILKVDLLGEPVSLKINKEASAKTVFGGILSILIVLTIGSIFVVFSQQVIYKQNPRIAVETRIFDRRPEIALNKDTMPIAFGISDTGTTYINRPDYFSFKVEVMFNENSDNSTMKFTQLKIRKCMDEDFPFLTHEAFVEISLNALMCIENFDVTLAGYWNEPTIQLLSIKLFYCQNSTDNTQNSSSCASLQEIKNFLQDTDYYFNVFFFDTSINLQNYTTPTFKYMMTKYQTIKAQSFKTMEIYLKNQIWESDDSFLFNNNITNASIAFDTFELFDSEIGSRLILFDCSFLSSNVMSIHYRVYEKISEVLADVGGLASVCLFFFKFLCYYFAIIKLNEQILNGIFDFDVNENSKILKFKIGRSSKFNFNREFLTNNCLMKQKEIIPQEKDEESDSVNSSIEGENHNKNLHIRRASLGVLELFNVKSKERGSCKSEKLHVLKPLFEEKKEESSPSDSLIERIKISKKNSIAQENKSKEEIQVNNFAHKPTQMENDIKENNSDVVQKILSFNSGTSKLNFSFCDICAYIFCSCALKPKSKKMFQLLSTSEKVLNELLDICYIVRKLEQLDKLKLVILNKEQIALFNFISKEVYSMNKDRRQSSMISQFKSYQNDQQELAKTIINFFEHLSNITEESKISEIDKKLFYLLHDDVKRNLSVSHSKSFIQMI